MWEQGRCLSAGCKLASINYSFQVIGADEKVWSGSSGVLYGRNWTKRIVGMCRLNFMLWEELVYGWQLATVGGQLDEVYDEEKVKELVQGVGVLLISRTVLP